MSNENFLTVVFRKPISEQAKAVLESADWSAASRGHAIHDRDAMSAKVEKLEIRIAELEAKNSELRDCAGNVQQESVPDIDHANELRRMARKIGRPAGDVPAVMRAAADRLEELERLVDAAIRARNEQIRSKIRPEFDCLYAATPGIFDLVTIEEFAARMGVSVADVMNDGAMRSPQDAEKQPPKNKD